MKKIKYILFLMGLAATVMVGCESDEDKYSGTPVGNQDIETIHGTLTIDPSITSALTNQKIPFSFELGRTFADTVTVEISSLNKSGGRTRMSVDVMPGQTGGSDEIPAAGGAIFNSTMDVYLSAIALKHTESGKHYLLDSNIITLNTGNTAVPVDDNTRLQVRFVWYNPSSTRNNFRVFVDRPNAANYVSSVGASNASTVITVGSTAGLQAGMSVQVSSGQGLFPSNTVVTSVDSFTTFTVSQAPTAANALGSNTVITGGGNDFILAGASSDVANAANINCGSTAGLEAGMTVTVIGGTGKFRPGTIISQIVDGDTFRVSLPPTSPNGVVLSNATVAVTYPDVISPGGSTHDILNSPTGQIVANISTKQGVYYFKLNPQSLLNSGADVPYRVVWKKPDGTSGFREGVFSAATLNSPSIDVLRVTKIGEGSGVDYQVDDPL